MNDQAPRFGWNLRTLNVVLFCGGLLTFVVLRVGLALRVLWWPWQVWAALVAGGLAVLTLLVYGWVLVNCIRQRRWKTLGALIAAMAACLLLLGPARDAFLPWTTIEGRVVDARTGEPLPGVKVGAQMINASQAKTRTRLADVRLMLAWLLSSGGQTQTDRQGCYRLCALPLGAYNLWAEQPGRTGLAIGSLAGNRNAPTAALDLRLGSGGIVKGRVINAATGEVFKLERRIDVVMFCGRVRPKSGGAVESAPIRGDGTFELRAPPGVSYLYVDGRTQKIVPVLVEEGETIVVDLPADF